MAESKCANCHRVLKGGEWQYQKRSDGTVVKVCYDKKICYERMRFNSYHICKN